MTEPEIVQTVKLPPEPVPRRRRARGSMREASEDVLVALRQIIHATDLHSKRVARESGLTIPQIVILNSVRELGEVTTRAISLRVSLSQGTVTSVLDRLEEKGLVERYRSVRDRRVVHTRLTRKGRTALDKAPALLQETFLDRFEDLSARRQGQIVTVLKDVARMMGATGIDAAPLLAAGPVKAARADAGDAEPDIP